MVDHKDQDRFNNHVSNLRWVTRAKNQQNTRANVVPGGLRKLVFESSATNPANVYQRIWQLIRTNGMSPTLAWEKILPDIPFPPQKDKPSL
ncbi:hypothetical protein D3C86_2021030 [compost metagenome]